MIEQLKLDSYKLAKKYAITHKQYGYLFDSFDDYIMALTYNLLYKLSKYNTEKSLFSTFAYMIFSNTIKKQSVCRYNKNENIMPISLDSYIFDDSSDTIEDIIADEDNNIDNYIAKNTIKLLYKQLIPHLSNEFIKHYAYNMNYEDIAKEKHVTKQSVRQSILREKTFIDECLKGNLITHTKTHQNLASLLTKMKNEIINDEILKG